VPAGGKGAWPTRSFLFYGLPGEGPGILLSPGGDPTTPEQPAGRFGVLEQSICSSVPTNRGWRSIRKGGRLSYFSRPLQAVVANQDLVGNQQPMRFKTQVWTALIAMLAAPLPWQLRARFGWALVEHCWPLLRQQLFVHRDFVDLAGRSLPASPSRPRKSNCNWLLA